MNANQKSTFFWVYSANFIRNMLYPEANCIGASRRHTSLAVEIVCILTRLNSSLGTIMSCTKKQNVFHHNAS